MIRLKSHSGCNSGFMLTEVLIAIAIVGIVITPILLIQYNALVGTNDFSGKIRRLFVMKNFMVEQGFKASEQKEQKAVAEKNIKDSNVTLKYVRDKIKKGLPPFKNFDDAQVGNLCVQRIEAEFGVKKKDVLIRFLYKPKIEK